MVPRAELLCSAASRPEDPCWATKPRWGYADSQRRSCLSPHIPCAELLRVAAPASSRTPILPGLILIVVADSQVGNMEALVAQPKEHMLCTKFEDRKRKKLAPFKTWVLRLLLLTPLERRWENDGGPNARLHNRSRVDAASGYLAAELCSRAPSHRPAPCAGPVRSIRIN